MNVKVTCEECGLVIWQKGDVEELVGPDGEEVYSDDCCIGPAMTLSDLKEPFGAVDVETLALAIYDVFHGGHHSPFDGWGKYNRELDDCVVEEFRTIALMAADLINETNIGSVYRVKNEKQGVEK